MRKFVLSFHTHFESITALKKAKENKNFSDVKLIAVPREISSSCGTAVQLLAQASDEFTTLKYDKAFECIGDKKFVEIE